jgi:hypothetical protein
MIAFLSVFLSVISSSCTCMHGNTRSESESYISSIQEGLEIYAAMTHD